MKLTSTAFEAQTTIPEKYTCEGADISPPLAWADAPPQTQSFAIVMDDPDAPKQTWVHWVAFDLPPDLRRLAENAAADLPAPARTGKNSLGKTTYGGPCPPSGRHRYVHQIYALDTKLALDSPTASELRRAMKGHVLAHAELVGTYEKTHRTARAHR